MDDMRPEALRLVPFCRQSLSLPGPHMWLSEHTSDGMGSGLVFAVRCNRLYKASTFALMLLPEKSIVGHLQREKEMNDIFQEGLVEGISKW